MLRITIKFNFIMQKKSSIAMFIAATSALAISTADTNSVKSGESDLGGLKEWNTDIPRSRLCTRSRCTTNSR